MAAAEDPRGYYEILGIGRTASAEEIRAAFRERAKRYHPDGGGAGSPEDEARFVRLREAFETLRDPQRRVRYDAEALASGRPRQRASSRPPPRGDGAAERAGTDAGAAADGEAGAGADVAAQARRLGAAAVALARPVLGWAASTRAALWLPLLVAVVLGAALWQRLARQDQAIAALSQRLEATTRRVADLGREGVLRGAARTLFRAELVFPRGLAELAPANLARAEATVKGLRDAIAGAPPGGGWSVLILGQARRPAEPAGGGGGAAGAWELTIRRMGAASDYLVRGGVPAERIAARFTAGVAPAAADDPPSVPEALQLRLLCCDG